MKKEKKSFILKNSAEISSKTLCQLLFSSMWTFTSTLIWSADFFTHVITKETFWQMFPFQQSLSSFLMKFTKKIWDNAETKEIHKIGLFSANPTASNSKWQLLKPFLSRIWKSMMHFIFSSENKLNKFRMMGQSTVS